jgi:hypothetical protein
MRRLLGLCPVLTRLSWSNDLAGCHPVKKNDNSENFAAAVITAPRLRHLHLSFIPGATALSILELAASCPQLARLEAGLAIKKLTQKNKKKP